MDYLGMEQRKDQSVLPSNQRERRQVDEVLARRLLV